MTESIESVVSEMQNIASKLGHDLPIESTPVTKPKSPVEKKVDPVIETTDEVVKTVDDKRDNELQQLKLAIDDIRLLVEKQEKVLQKQTMSQLKQEKDKASTAGDKAALEAIKAQEVELQRPPTPAAIRDFEAKNQKWLTGNSYQEIEMQKFIFERDQLLVQKSAYLPVGQRPTPAQHAELLQEHIEAKFPDYFKSEKPNKTQSVEGGGDIGNTLTPSKKKFSRRDLNSDQLHIAESYERMGVMKVDDYINELHKMGELK